MPVTRGSIDQLSSEYFEYKQLRAFQVHASPGEAKSCPVLEGSQVGRAAAAEAAAARQGVVRGVCGIRRDLLDPGPSSKVKVFGAKLQQGYEAPDY